MLPFPHRARPEIRNEVRNNRMTVFPAPKPEIRSVYRSILKATTDKINRKTSPANRYKERQYWRKVVPQSDDLSDAPNPIIESISFRNLLNRVHDNSYFSVFALSLAILTLVPLMLKISFQLESSNLSKAIRSPEFLGITSASIALTGPVLMDVILDLYTDKTANFHSYNHILFTVVPCIVFFQGDTLYDFETCFICFFYAQLLSCSAIAFSLLMKSCPKVFTPFRCYFLLTTFGINVFLHLYGFSVGDNSAKMGGLVLHQIFLVLCLIIAITYSSYFYLHHKDLFHSMQFRKIISQLSTDEYSTLFAISGGIVYVLGFFSTQFSYGGSLRMIDAYTANEILWYYICNNIFLMMVEKLPGRLTKWETQKLMNNLETKRSFVRYVSHEIRTPLNTVFLGLDLVEHRLEANSIDIDAITGMVKELRESCLIATEILNDLLNYEKLDAGIMKLERTMVYPVPFIVKVLHPFHVQAEQKKINLYILRSQIEDENSEFKNWKLDIDESKMGQVLRNFVSNALKFTPPSGTVTVSITKVVSSDSTPSLRLEVRDSGHGISKENQRKVFNEIIQFNANTQQGGGGSGLGLWISKFL